MEPKLNKSHTIPVPRLLYKDDRNWAPGKDPIPTMGICGANAGMNAHLR